MKTQYEITRREVLFSSVILAIMVILGSLIQNPIVSNCTRKALETIAAIQVNEAKEFSYIERTSAGPFLAEGDLIANDIITLPELLPSQFSKIEKVKEEYCEHTEIITKTDKDGKTTTETRTYWSWDVKDRESFETKDFTFLEKKFTAKEIRYRIHTSYKTTIYEKGWSDIRYVYYTAPVIVHGTLSGDATEKSLTNKKFHSGDTIEQIVKNAENSITRTPIIFWILWMLLTAALIALFYYFENKWLYDNNQKEKRTHKRNKRYKTIKPVIGTCKSCGAPLDKRTCRYCNVTN